MAAGFCKEFLVVLVVVCMVHEGVSKPPPWAMSKKHGPVGKFDGDILLDESTLSRLQNPDDPNPSTRNIHKDAIYLWPNGVVPYVFHSSFDAYPHERTMILSAIGEVHKASCVRFVQRTTEQYYISFTRGSGCSSYVGRLQMAAQPVSIGQNCAFTGTILHELLHVLGFFHTSSRPDRDSYVIVYTDNIASGYEHNFWKFTSDQIDALGAPYELTSLMHPPRNAWSKTSRNTIVARKGSNVVLGNSNKMTEVDIGQLNTLYKCSASLYPVCYQSLGMQDGRIKDAQLTASSHNTYDYPHQARLHLVSNAKGSGSWCANPSNAGEWLQIDLGSYKYVKGIATQGKIDPFGVDTWVTKYNFHFSYDGSYWYNYATWFSGGLTANWDATSVAYNKLPVLISARYLRILPTTWKGAMCMRVEIFGCNY